MLEREQASLVQLTLKNHRMVCAGRNLKDHPAAMDRDAFHRSGWSNPCPTQPWTPLGMGHSQLLKKLYPMTGQDQGSGTPKGKQLDGSWTSEWHSCCCAHISLLPSKCCLSTNAVSSAPLAARAGQFDHASSPQLQLCTTLPPWCSLLNCLAILP